MIEGALTEEKLRASVWPRFSRVRSSDAIYLANHSLGRPPDRMAEDVSRALESWYRDLDGAWQLWLEARQKFRALTATLVGAQGADSIVPKTSAGQGLRAVLNTYDAPIRVLTTDAEFDSIDFILRVYRDRKRIELATVPARVEALVAALKPRCELVVVSSVLFRTGEIVPDLAKLIRRAHAAGARVLIDTYHHAGVLALDLASLDADFAVGGCYKYLRGGPGACWLYVHPRHQKLVTLDTGWFAKKDVFKYERPDPPQFAPGGDAWLESTPPVLAAVQALAGLEFTLEIGVERLREYHFAQKQRFAALLREQGILPEGAGASYGAFLSLRHLEARRLAAELARRGVAVDVRGDRMRLCADLLNSDAELATAAARLGALLR